MVINTALDGGGRAVGILPYGSDFIKNDYNHNNIEKFTKNKNFVLILPFEKDQKPCKETFSFRNHLMLSMSRIILVIEAGAKSKVFYLVDSALDMGKDIYCVPGNVFSEKSIGTNNMIKDGANLVNDITEIISQKF
ncbi:hypothetical protein A2V49_02405 [candidate division WWE3 bacterium RBG_19FT_COMBO_34_6]|uniref:Smf/DprA SLOG domain-containing protein n=1 Tax=candidate division WWE3 bacterium RBG_19FT_COMBO_34_6 TaxID=1802612 RepID=A0A1F4UN61_UNCKA|nr:MAG: hypothetical protein A2V49_02405 [candidate division WWE3 bacterium RBG_19FT_COMBO_34_6]